MLLSTILYTSKVLQYMQRVIKPETITHKDINALWEGIEAE
jgi:hypothetical protein